MFRPISLVAFLLCGASGVEVFAQSAKIEVLGQLDSNTSRSLLTEANAVSPDGQTVTGQSHAPNFAVNGRTHAIRWTPSDELQDLGALDPTAEDAVAEGMAVSANGMIVGRSTDSTGRPVGFRWTESAGMQALAALGASTAASGVSDDGMTIVGSDYDPADDFARHRGLRWSGLDATLTELGTIGGFVGHCGASACSPDGSIIAGFSWNGVGYHACLFRDGQPPLDLGGLNGAGGHSSAFALTPNGDLVVGQARTPTNHFHAAYWTKESGMVDLGTVDGVWGGSIALDVSGDGRVIGGASASAHPDRGSAAVWIDGKAKLLWDLLDDDYETDPGDWFFHQVRGVSRDGSVLVGTGIFEGNRAAFRITLTENDVPKVTAPTPVSVECEGGANTVELSAQVNDGDPNDRLLVSWSVGGAVRKRVGDVVPGSTVTFAYKYRDGETPVEIRVSDGDAETSATTKVTVVDTASPIIVVAPDVYVDADPGRAFATNVRLRKPFVHDVCDPAPNVKTNARKRYPIGATKVTWTVRDKSGNVAKSVQRVIVRNDRPIAHAGPDVIVRTERSRVALKMDGSLSNDPNGQELKYLWESPGIRFSNPKAPRPTASFGIGSATVTLTVTDEGGRKSTDVLHVNVRAIRSARTAATLADASVREAHANGLDSHSRGKGDSLNAAGLSLAASALALSAEAGDDVGADEDAPVSQADLTSYLTLRATAAQQARMAGERFYESFLVSGDGNALAASMYAYYGSGYSQADLSSDDVIEVLKAGIEE